MKFYLSSYKLGKDTEKLKGLIRNGKIGYIPNARDAYVDKERRMKRTEEDMDSLRELDVQVELLDLRDYFGKRDELQQKLGELGAIFISGGNVFVLRQAMKLSGLDEALRELKDTDFLYAGYSAAGCVLAPSLKAYPIVDKPETPYEELSEVIWDEIGRAHV